MRLPVIYLCFSVSTSQYWWMGKGAFDSKKISENLGNVAQERRTSKSYGYGGYKTSTPNEDQVVLQKDPNLNVELLPLTECPHEMKCVSELFCDANATMVPFRVQLSQQELDNRGSLIPCMNQATGQFDVCCHRLQEDPLQGEPSVPLPQHLSKGQVSSDEVVEILPSSETDLSFPSSQQQFGSGSLPSLAATTCPVLSTLPPLSDCEGRSSNCWSVGVRDLDCINSALCCFDGCANVCMGEGPILNNGKSESLQSPITEKNLMVANKNPQQVEDTRQEGVYDLESSGGEAGTIKDVQKFDLNIQQLVQPTQSEIEEVSKQNKGTYFTESQTPSYNRKPEAVNIDIRTYGGIVFPEEHENDAEQFNYYNNILPNQLIKDSQVGPTSPKDLKDNLESDRKSTTNPTQILQKIQEETEGVFEASNESFLNKNNAYGDLQADQPDLFQKAPQRTILTNGQPPRDEDIQPWVQCPSAMKCVPKSFCDLNGVMVQQEIFLTKELEALRVQLIPCVNAGRGFSIDICCRDPNYEDPWPQNNESNGAETESIGIGAGNEEEVSGTQQTQKLEHQSPTTSSSVNLRKSQRPSYGK